MKQTHILTLFALALVIGVIGFCIVDQNTTTTEGDETMTVYTGSCGTSATYTLDTDTGVLTISGSGAMTDWTGMTYVPWYGDSYRPYIKSIVIEEGITHIGKYAFYRCNSVTSVTFYGDQPTFGNSSMSFAFNRDGTNVTVYSTGWASDSTIPSSVRSTYDTFTYVTVSFAPTIPVNVGGSWKDATPYVNVGGTWKEVTNAYVNVGGTWREVS